LTQDALAGSSSWSALWRLLRSYRDPEHFQDQPFKNKLRLPLASSFALFFPALQVMS
jgi:hypothetical protein